MLLGAIIIAWINYQTYLFIEVTWNEYKKYYEEKYNKCVTDMKQPLTSSMPTKGGEQSGVSSPIYLIPELDGQQPNCSKSEPNDKLGIGAIVARLQLGRAIINSNLIKNAD